MQITPRSKTCFQKQTVTMGSQTLEVFLSFVLCTGLWYKIQDNQKRKQRILFQIKVQELHLRPSVGQCEELCFRELKTVEACAVGQRCVWQAWSHLGLFSGACFSLFPALQQRCWPQQAISFSASRKTGQEEAPSCVRKAVGEGGESLPFLCPARYWATTVSLSRCLLLSYKPMITLAPSGPWFLSHHRCPCSLRWKCLPASCTSYLWCFNITFHILATPSLMPPTSFTKFPLF